MEEALYDIPVLRSFAGLDAFEDNLLEETTILRFRHLLNKHQLATAIFDELQTVLLEHKLLLKQSLSSGYHVDWRPQFYQDQRQKTWTRNEPN